MSNIKYKVNKSMFTIALLLVPVMAFGMSSIGDVANNLMGPTSIVTKFVDIACYIIGLVFIMMSIAQYKIHRQSPKLVPLMTPILLLVLGIIALCIPYVTQKPEATGKAKIESTEKSALPLPTPTQKSPGLPYPPSHKQDTAPPSSTSEQSETTPASPSSDSDSSSPPAGGGGWTSDPKYNH